MGYISWIFMVLVILFYGHHIYYSKASKEGWEEMDARSIKSLVRYLYFLGITSFFAHMFFDIDLFLWISLFASAGIIIGSKTGGGHKPAFFAFALILLAFLMFSTPKHPAAFEDYINGKGEYHCMRKGDCVRVTEVVTAEDLLETKVEMLTVEQSTTDWYFLIVKGSLILKDQDGNLEEFKGFNIGGIWFEY